MEYIQLNIQMLLQTLRVYIQNADRADSKRGLDLVGEISNVLEKLITSSNLNRHKRKECQTMMTHLIRTKNPLQHLLQTFDGTIEMQTSQADEAKVCWNEKPSAFQKRIKSGVITNLGHRDIEKFMSDAQMLFKEKIEAALEQFSTLKINAELSADYVIKKNDAEFTDIKYFYTTNNAVNKTTDLIAGFNKNIRELILQQMEEFQDRESGWSLKQILTIIINMNQYVAMQDSSYIPLAKFIRDKHAYVNVDNQDNECFKWAIGSAFHPNVQKPCRISSYKAFENKLNFKDINFPVTLKPISKFEKQNGISVNVFILKKYGERYKVTTASLTSAYQKKHVNLLLIQVDVTMSMKMIMMVVIERISTFLHLNFIMYI